VDHGTAREWGLRYRLTRASETRVLRRANAITTICSGLREEMITRGIRSSKITQIPNAVDIDAFNPSDAPDAALQAELGLQGKTVLGFLGSFYAYEGSTCCSTRCRSCWPRTRISACCWSAAGRRSRR